MTDWGDVEVETYVTRGVQFLSPSSGVSSLVPFFRPMRFQISMASKSSADHSRRHLFDVITEFVNAYLLWHFKHFYLTMFKSGNESHVGGLKWYN